MTPEGCVEIGYARCEKVTTLLDAFYTPSMTRMQSQLIAVTKEEVTMTHDSNYSPGLTIAPLPPAQAIVITLL